MDLPSFKKINGLFGGSYLFVLLLALYFSRGLKAVYPPTYWVLVLAGMGILLCCLFLLIFRGRAPELSAGTQVSILGVFQLMQGALGFALGYFIFHLPLLEALAFPVGAIIGFLTWWMLSLGLRSEMSGLGLAVLGALGLVLALRMQGVVGGLVYGLAILNGFWLGALFLKGKTATLELWLRGVCFIALLVVGRAAIQYYLWQSNYANLGVVITHPYTYAALFGGIFLPLLVWTFQKDKIFPLPVALLIFGVLLPLALGIFIHVRPMAGYLLGLVSSSFLLGLYFQETYRFAWVAYLNLASVCAGLALFRHFNNLSRWIRLEILGALFVIALIAFFVIRLKSNRAPETA